MIDINKQEAWFVTGSQHLYGEDLLQQVAKNSEEICHLLNVTEVVPIKIVWKQVLTTSEAILQFILEANASKECVGIICWMHTFSPAKMWINGLKIIQKPLMHLHTQYSHQIPWQTIDMDYMNLHQSAHGGREFGFVNSRLRLPRKIVVGHWKESTVHEQIASWSRACCGKMAMSTMQIARFGDNMRQVAVTEGNQVSAQIQFGFFVNGFGLGDLKSHYDMIEQHAITHLTDEYESEYEVDGALRQTGSRHNSLRDAARLELALRSFLVEGGFTAFTTTFENLTGLPQLPGIAVQRLMEDGYGFGAEGDWKTAALVRTMKVMSQGLSGGNSFMEDYTYHLTPNNSLVLGSHMLEICPSLTDEQPHCEIHPLQIGGKSDPVRLVFTASTGPALNASLIDLGNRFRLITNEVEAIVPGENMPSLPVAKALWQPLPDLATAAKSWIYSGGAHHTCYSQSLTKEHMEDFADMFGIELLHIDKETEYQRFKQDVRTNEVYYHLFGP